jgi:hypothetical protein
MSAYLLLLLLIAVRFWNMKLLSPILSGEMTLFLFLISLAVGCVLFARRATKALFNVRNNVPVILIVIGIILSFIPAKIYWGQSLITSIVATRVGLCYLALPVLLFIRPSKSEIKHALYCFSFLYFIMMVLCMYLHMDLVVIPEETLMKRDIGDSLVSLEGFQYVAMAFIFSMEDLFKRVTRKKIVYSCLFFATILLYQNRTTIFACAVCAAFMLLKIRNTRRNIIIKIGAVSFILIVLLLSWRMIASLLQETTVQLGDETYNRNLAYLYFIFEAPQGLMSYFLGNGFISAKSSTIMADLMASGIYNSDVGIIGLWNQFGILPAITVIVCCIIPFLKKMPLYIQSMALLIVCCSLTTAYFFAFHTIIWLCMYLYMLCRYHNKQHQWMSRS